ncbi:hypothetical protein ACX3P1_03925 [Mesorhizobium sp. A623]
MKSTLKRYLRGEVPLGRVFWFDMLLVGTIINALTSACALIAYALDLPGWLALAIFLSPVPYKLALCLFVWRSATRKPSAWSDVARGGAVLWLLMVLVL